MFKFIVFVVLIEITSAAIIEPTDDLVIGNIIARQATSFTCPEKMRGNYCAHDCKTLLTCTRRTTVPAVIRTCSDVSPSRPFCTPGARSCSAAGESTITSCSTSSKFICTNTGYFPDPSKCNQYHVCTDESSETYECPPRYVYDAVSLKCKRQRFLRDCLRINCGRSQRKYVVYPTQKSYYAYCGLGGEITMFRCADMGNFEFNPTTVNCEFVCKAEGTYPDYKNEQQFYECFRSRRRFMSRIQKCPAKYVFDRATKLCVKCAATTVAPTTTTQASTPPQTTTTATSADSTTSVTSTTTEVTSNITDSTTRTATDTTTTATNVTPNGGNITITDERITTPNPENNGVSTTTTKTTNGITTDATITITDSTNSERSTTIIASATGEIATITDAIPTVATTIPFTTTSDRSTTTTDVSVTDVSTTATTTTTTRSINIGGSTTIIDETSGSTTTTDATATTMDSANSGETTTIDATSASGSATTTDAIAIGGPITTTEATTAGVTTNTTDATMDSTNSGGITTTDAIIAGGSTTLEDVTDGSSITTDATFSGGPTTTDVTFTNGIVATSTGGTTTTLDATATGGITTTTDATAAGEKTNTTDALSSTNTGRNTTATEETGEITTTIDRRPTVATMPAATAVGGSILSIKDATSPTTDIANTGGNTTIMEATATAGSTTTTDAIAIPEGSKTNDSTTQPSNETLAVVAVAERQESIYFNPTHLSHSAVKINSSQQPPNKSMLIEWLLHSK